MHARLLSLPSLMLFAAALFAGGCTQPQPEAQASESAVTETAVQPGATTVAAADAPVIHVYKTPTCGCCKAWVTHLQDEGFRTEVQDLPDLTSIKDRYGVPGHLGSCHTATVGGYVIEGHVPASTIRRLLEERPEVAGIAVPGMPMGSPGMEGLRKDPYNVVAFRSGGGEFVYESR